MAAKPLDSAKRKQILRVIFISLLLDLVCARGTVAYSLRDSADVQMVDIIHLHSPTLPKTPRVLPKP